MKRKSIQWLVMCAVSLGIILLAAAIMTRLIGASQSRAADRVETMPLNQDAPAAEETSIEDALNTAAYTLVEREQETWSASRREGEITPAEAAYRGAEFIQRLCSADPQSDLTGKTVYIQYERAEGVPEGSYRMRVGEGDYELYIGASDGAVRILYRVPPENAQKEDWGDTASQEYWSHLTPEMEAAAVSRAQEIILGSLAQGRSILEDSFIDGMMDYQEMGYTICMDYKAHMSQGECYLLRLTYPGYELIELDCYPLGWHACQCGYWNSGDAELYSSADGERDWEDVMSEAGQEALQPQGADGSFVPREIPDSEQLTIEEYACLAQLAQGCVGKAVSTGYENESGHSRWFIDMLLDQMGYALNGADAKSLSRGDDPDLVPGYRLAINEQSDQWAGIHALYVGNGNYVYADAVSGLVIQRSLTEDFGGFVQTCRMLTIKVQTVHKGFPDESVAIAYRSYAEKAEALVGSSFDSSLTEALGYSQAFVREVYGFEEPIVDGSFSSGSDIFSPEDTQGLLPGLQLGLALPGPEGNGGILQLNAISLGQGKYVYADPDTHLICLGDLTEDMANRRILHVRSTYVQEGKR